MATVGIVHQRAVVHGEILAEQLQATLHWRIVIEQAKGVLAEHGNLDMHQAYTLLRTYARRRGQRLSDLAADLAEGTVDPRDLLTQHAQLDDDSMA